MILGLIICFFVGGIVGAACMGAIAASRDRKHQMCDPCELCTLTCNDQEKRYCCVRCRWVFDGEPPCDDCSVTDV